MYVLYSLHWYVYIYIWVAHHCFMFVGMLFGLWGLATYSISGEIYNLPKPLICHSTFFLSHPFVFPISFPVHSRVDQFNAQPRFIYSKLAVSTVSRIIAVIAKNAMVVFVSACRLGSRIAPSTPKLELNVPYLGPQVLWGAQYPPFSPCPHRGPSHHLPIIAQLVGCELQGFAVAAHGRGHKDPIVFQLVGGMA